jgi:hypothetical protein
MFGNIQSSYVTLGGDQEVTGKKRFLNNDNEFEGFLTQPTILALNEIIDANEISFLAGVSSNIQTQFEGVNIVLNGLTGLEQALQAIEPAPNATTVKFADTILLEDPLNSGNTLVLAPGNISNVVNINGLPYPPAAPVNFTDVTLTGTATSITSSTLGVTSAATFTNSPIFPTPATSDNSTKAATTAYVKTIAAPANFLGLANSFFNSFIYSNNPNPDYMIAGNLGGLNPVVNAAIIAPGTTSFMLMGVRLQAGVSFNRYGWNENAGNPLRCALYTSQFIYVPNSISAYTSPGTPANTGGKVEVTTAAMVTIPTTDTYYIYMDGSGAAGGNTVYGAQSTNFNLMNYTDFASASFTLLSSTNPFKVATGVKLAAASPLTTMNDLKVSNAAMTYTAYVLGVFLRIVV